ncbi:MAG: GNAT family N-acetyltransferase [Clostridia bacterium]|nr:GNAT family N-acetyltransferase [Clostridia bacterium]
MTIREANAADAALISRIIAASWRGAYQELIDPVYLARLPEEYWLPSMRAWLGSGRMYGYIALDCETPVGCVICGRGRDESHADWGEIVSLYVLPEKMHQGVGTMLLTKALESLREDGFEQVYLWAIDGNSPADKFYRSHGFRPTEDFESYKIGQWQMKDIRYILGGQA